MSNRKKRAADFSAPNENPNLQALSSRARVYLIYYALMKFQILLTATLCLGLCGCFTMEQSTAPNGEQHLFTSNYGWYLFNWIPLVSGNVNPDGWSPFAFFRDDVTMDKMQSRITQRAIEQNRQIDTLVYNNYDQIFMNLPLTSISIPIPYVICYREIQLSGVVK